MRRAAVERTLWKTLIATISGDIDGNCSSSVSWATAAQAAEVARNDGSLVKFPHFFCSRV
uniref:Uncharacterized protein n=2 Tax=Oryza sativa subsp. japonica TaxID=39947 RepID=Q2R9V9_ORYSJ|nr:hypothetical protein LOC_Os11g07410 [Oryza sativa Japonica Group]ABA91754.1 hypothetical protein LOC_Os11g07410 [Oryza sativa Japonica Group]